MLASSKLIHCYTCANLWSRNNEKNARPWLFFISAVRSRYVWSERNRKPYSLYEFDSRPSAETSAGKKVKILPSIDSFVQICCFPTDTHVEGLDKSGCGHRCLLSQPTSAFCSVFHSFRWQHLCILQQHLRPHAGKRNRLSTERMAVVCRQLKGRIQSSAPALRQQ